MHFETGKILVSLAPSLAPSLPPATCSVTASLTINPVPNPCVPCPQRRCGWRRPLPEPTGAAGQSPRGSSIGSPPRPFRWRGMWTPGLAASAITELAGGPGPAPAQTVRGSGKAHLVSCDQFREDERDEELHRKGTELRFCTSNTSKTARLCEFGPPNSIGALIQFS